ncbi:MAG: ROK family protein [Cyanobacteria bacterium P01_D01_bin.36]
MGDVGNVGDVGEKAGVVTLAVDIGGSGVKALLLNEKGEPLDERDRIKTPKPATPDAVMAVLKELVSRKGHFDRVSVGFPGVIRKGVVYTAVNLHPDWREHNLAGEFSQMVGKPVRVANDADLQGMGAVHGDGVELVMTLGTGIGGALFTEGIIVPNFELGHFRFRKGETYEEQLGRAALKKVGKKTWNNRLAKAIASLSRVLNYDHLYIGGGEVKQIEIDLPENATVVANVLGLLGGIKLWKDV